MNFRKRYIQIRAIAMLLAVALAAMSIYALYEAVDRTNKDMQLSDLQSQLTVQHEHSAMLEKTLEEVNKEMTK